MEINYSFKDLFIFYKSVKLNEVWQKFKKDRQFKDFKK